MFPLLSHCPPLNFLPPGNPSIGSSFSGASPTTRGGPPPYQELVLALLLERTDKKGRFLHLVCSESAPSSSLCFHLPSSMCLKVFFLREVTQFYDIWNSFFAVIKMWRNFCVNIFVPTLRLMHSVFLLLLFMILDFGPGVTFMIKYLWQRYFIPWWSCIPGTWFNIFFFIPSFLVPIRYRYGTFMIWYRIW